MEPFSFRHLPTTSQTDVTANFEQLQPIISELGRDTGWITLALKSGWKNSVGEAGYRIIGTVVYLRGVVEGGTTNTEVALLPEAAWPTEIMAWGATGGSESMAVFTTGKVVIAFSGAITNFGISFSYPLQ